MKRRVIKIGVLVILFAAALVISSLVVNRRRSIYGTSLPCRGGGDALTSKSRSGNTFSNGAAGQLPCLFALLG